MLAALMVGDGLVLPAAYQSAPSIIIATFDYTYLIFATLLGIVAFAEIPDLQTVIGIVMIAGAGLIVRGRALLGYLAPTQPNVFGVIVASAAKNADADHVHQFVRPFAAALASRLFAEEHTHRVARSHPIS